MLCFPTPTAPLRRRQVTKERPKELRGHLCSDVVTEVRNQCKSLATLIVPMFERSGDLVAVAGTQYLGSAVSSTGHDCIPSSFRLHAHRLSASLACSFVPKVLLSGASCRRTIRRVGHLSGTLRKCAWSGLTGT